MAFLSLQTLFEYLEATPSSRCVNEGQAVLNAKHIITCGITSKKGKEFELFGLCLQTSALTQRPHEIKGTLCVKEVVVSIVKFVCACKTGNSGQCKHIAAVLLLCTRDSVLKLPQLSSTDLKCYWTSQKGQEQYMLVPLLEQDCLKSRVYRDGKVLSEVETNNVLRICEKICLPLCAYSLHRNRCNKRPEENNISNINDVVHREHINEVLKKCEEFNILDLLATPTFSRKCCEEFYETLKNVNILRMWPL